MTNGKDWAEEEALRTMEAIASDAPPNRWPSAHIASALRAAEARGIARALKIADAGYIQCPKCGALSGDDWSQCGGSCPMPASPYYHESAEHAFAAADGEDVGHA